MCRFSSGVRCYSLLRLLGRFVVSVSLGAEASEAGAPGGLGRAPPAGEQASSARASARRGAGEQAACGRAAALRGAAVDGGSGAQRPPQLGLQELPQRGGGAEV